MSTTTSRRGSMSPGDSRPKVVLTRYLGEEVHELLKLLERADLEVVVSPKDGPCDRDWLLKNVPGAVGIIVMMTEKVDRELIDAAGPSLCIISTMSVGYDHIDTSLLAKRGIKVGYTPDVLTDAVADLSIMLALMAGRNAGETLTLVKDGQWPNFTWSPFGFCGPQFSAPPSPYSPSPSSSSSSSSPAQQQQQTVSSSTPSSSSSSSQPRPVSPSVQQPRPVSSSPSSQRQQRTVGFLGFGRIAQAVLARTIPFGFTRCVYTGNPRHGPKDSSTTDSTPGATPDASASENPDGASASENPTPQPTPLELQILSKHPTLTSLTRVPLPVLAAQSDVLFILAPGPSPFRTTNINEGLYHVINSSFLRQMKPTSVLVNTSRGSLVDSEALGRAVRERWIWGAGVDVVEGEPGVGGGHVLVREPQCVVLPHLGSATLETRSAMATMAANNLLAGLFGERMPAELDLDLELV